MLAILASIMVLEGVGIDFPTFVAGLALAFAVGFGVLGVWQAVRLENLTKAIVKLTVNLSNNQIEEKIAMIHSYAANVNTWKRGGLDIEEQSNKVISDLRALAEIDGEELKKRSERVRDALGGLFKNMAKDNDFEKQAERIRAEAKHLKLY